MIIAGMVIMLFQVSSPAKRDGAKGAHFMFSQSDAIGTGRKQE